MQCIPYSLVNIPERFLKGFFERRLLLLRNLLNQVVSFQNHRNNNVHLRDLADYLVKCVSLMANTVLNMLNPFLFRNSESSPDCFQNLKQQYRCHNWINFCSFLWGFVLAKV